MIKRGEIYFTDLNPAPGREQAGYRALLVVLDQARLMGSGSPRPAGAMPPARMDDVDQALKLVLNLA